ncbi:glycoside hydrolase family 95 protein [Paenibacillus segetis]|uniref:Alpha/beta hydrolase n=1 Tax=Paenibacillus segetis TaxID=1325360 RepID=A0ABQ1Y413_9BACL|nr:glycoside hydrolase family 95 protein [Paenibacillus segetis]GGH10880.1 alpha/beta hydrolase [Paenibacillus segetis]
MTSSQNKLYYTKPAQRWAEALPLGNGRMGAMVYGGVQREQIQLNEDTLWAGYPRAEHNPDAATHLGEARRLLAEERYIEAQELIEGKMLGTSGSGVQPYQPLGNLYLDFEGEFDDQGYRRELDLNTAIATTHIGEGATSQKRSVFISAVDQVMVVHLESVDPKGLHLTVTMDSELRHTLQDTEDGGMVMVGRCPQQVQNHNNELESILVYDEEESGKAMRFAAAIQVLHEGGEVDSEATGPIKVKGARTLTLLYTSATSFDGFDQVPGTSGRDPIAICSKVLEAAKCKSYDTLLESHLSDYQALFQRVELQLCEMQLDTKLNLIPTDERIQGVMSGVEDPGLIALVYQYGRYLLISSSRPGTQAANLQGIWNDMIQPPWNCDYHFNINLQMNYWLAETSNLSECHEPLFSLIEEQSVTGEETARIQYDCGGWTAHTMSDIWRTNNVGSRGEAEWAYWPMAGAWLCQHLWEHYLFTQDRDFLEQRAWPILKGAAQFVLDWLIDDEQGHLTTSPSVSPENNFLSPNEQVAVSVSQGSSMDISLCRELLTTIVEAGAILNLDEDFVQRCEAARSRLRPLEIGANGQVVEWNHDFAENDPLHRHVSHLYGMYPGHEFTMERTPEFSQAVRRSLELRGNEGTGWSMGWKVALWARLHDGDQASQVLHNFLNLVEEGGFDYHKGGIYPNLFCAHPPFQIDGNFGATAGITELLLQSHQQDIHLLPALPSSWSEGNVKGLRARGGYTVDISWMAGDLTEAKVLADRDGTCTVRYRDKILTVECISGVPVIIDYDHGRLVVRSAL